MKSVVFFVFLFVFSLSVPVFAQFGRATAGLQQLRLSGSLPGGAETTYQNFAWGGGGFGRIGERFLIGGGGWGALRSPWQAAATDGLQTRTNYGMGFLDAGWILAQRKRHFHYFFAGVGGGDVRMEYTNTGSSALELSPGFILAPEQQVRLQSGGFGWEAGLSLNRLLYSREARTGGYKIGVELGMSMLPRMSAWGIQGTNTTLNDFGRPNATTFFIRLSLGGGWL